MLGCLTLFFCVGLVFADWKSSVLNRHNELRSKVALGNEPGVPSAKYMARMSWDADLAAQAQTYADQCIWAHDSNNRAGENLAQNSVTDSYVLMVDAWYNEVLQSSIADYDSVTVEELDRKSPMIGHYTQLVWHNSAKLGCGYTKGCAGAGFMGPSMELLVCRYSPAGNFPGRPIFETGSPCEKCNGTCLEGLCDGGIKGGVCLDKYTNCKSDLKQYCNTVDWIARDCYKTCQCDSSGDTGDTCVNKYANCDTDLRDHCGTLEWVARDCAKTCTQGKCDGVVRVKSCVNKFSNCDADLKDYCGSLDWVAKDCAKTCTQGKCDGVIRVDTCVNKYANCDTDLKEYCNSLEWVSKECPKTCNTC